MNLAESKSFQVGFSTSATGGCWLVGFRSGGQSAPDMKGICSSSSLLMGKCKTKYIQGKQQALDAVWWTQICSKLASWIWGLWGRVVTIIKVTRSSSRGFQKHFWQAMWKENHEKTWAWVAKLIVTRFCFLAWGTQVSFLARSPLCDFGRGTVADTTDWASIWQVWFCVSYVNITIQISSAAGVLNSRLRHTTLWRRRLNENSGKVNAPVYYRRPYYLSPVCVTPSFIALLFRQRFSMTVALSETFSPWQST